MLIDITLNQVQLFKGTMRRYFGSFQVFIIGALFLLFDLYDNNELMAAPGADKLPNEGVKIMAWIASSNVPTHSSESRDVTK
jgi:hypothetical protein